MIYGLTGNIGCGKSTIVKLLKTHDNVVVFDCDEIAKKLMIKKSNVGKIREILGEDSAKIIFNDSIKKQKIEGLIHPQVWNYIQNRIKTMKSEKIFIVESALIFEIGWERRFEKIIVAVCNKEDQYKRLKNKNNWSDSQIKEIIKNQLPSEIKEQKGDFIVDTNCSMEELKARVEKLYTSL